MERDLPRLPLMHLLLLLAVISTFPRQGLCLQIRPQECFNTVGDSGTCMFVWDCIKTEGTHLGTCADGFLFGSCCGYSESKNHIIPSLELSSEDDKYQKFPTSVSIPKPSSISPSYALNTSTTYKPHIISTVTSVPHFSKPKPTYSKPSSTSYQIFTKPASTSTTSGMFDINLTNSINPNKNSYLSSTKKPLRPTTDKNSYLSTIENWLSFHTTPKPYPPTKIPTSFFTSPTYSTPKYPFTRPSWKPFPTKPVSTTTAVFKPILFTYTASNNSYRPTFTPFTTKHPHVSSPMSVDRNFTTVVINLPSHTQVNTGTKSTFKPFVSITQNLPPSTISHRPTTPRPFYSTFSGTKQPQTTTQFSWFSPHKHKSTVVPTSPSTQEENVFVVSSSVQEIFPTVSPPSFPDRPKISTSVSPIMTNTEMETTTPLPVTPCGLPIPHPQKKVVGGTNSAFGSWPWQASVRRTSFFGFSSTHRCGGALISRQWIATAGHCVDDLLLSQIKIRVGEYDFASVQEPYGYVERGAKKKVVHPRYNFFTYENDLALVQLEEEIDPTSHPHISPICLPPTEEYLVGKNATVTGWGRLSEGGVLPSILQEVQVPIISNEKCKDMFLAAGRHEYIPDIFMCAGFEEGGRDSCQGDSGGPLQIQADEGYWFLAGIISWGIGCAEPNMPGVCTRISKFKDWVVQQII